MTNPTQTENDTMRAQEIAGQCQRLDGLASEIAKLEQLIRNELASTVAGQVDCHNCFTVHNACDLLTTASHILKVAAADIADVVPTARVGVRNLALA